VVVINLSGFRNLTGLLTASLQFRIFGRGGKEEIGNGYLGEVVEIPRQPGGGHPLLKKGDALFASFNL
jgi:hypothetical protein